MKKIVLFGFILCCLISCPERTFSQIDVLGIQAGMNYSGMTFSDSFSNDPIHQTNPIIGINIGIIAEIKLIDNLQIRNGIYLSSKGANYTEGESSHNYYPVNLTIKLQYLDIPILLQYKFFKRNVKLFLNAGPVLSIGLIGSYQFESYDDFQDEKLYFGKNEDVKAFDFGISGGGGIDFARIIELSMTYNRGLVQVSDFIENNWAISISLTFLFREKKQPSFIKTIN